ncbi:hypothetical protein LVJ94_06415 [Pendulispora rubella]|uniref:Secreted protein n=1 Tax=Pendulispora rubella TaxID=2741070 RepID=A0ABZ2LDQ7_9BACT
MKCLVVTTILFGSMCACGHEEVLPDRKADLTGSDLCTSITMREHTCHEEHAEGLSDCDRMVIYMDCAYEPQFQLDYADCRGNTQCDQRADDEVCMSRAGRAKNEKETAACEAKAQACHGQWSTGACLYPRFQPAYRTRIEHCLDIASCDEQASCIDGVIASIASTCPTRRVLKSEGMP